jgi:hypothetical protein
MGTELLMTAIVVIEGVVILLLLILVAGLLKSHAEILRQLHRLGGATESGDAPAALPSVGFGEAPTTELIGTDLEGATRTISLITGRSPTLLAFMSSGCASCRTFFQELHGDLEPPLPDTRTVVVTKGPRSESPAKLAELAPEGTTLVMSDETWDDFRVPLTPYFLLLDGQARVIGEGSAGNWNQLLSLLRQSVADTGDPTQLSTTDREQFTDSRLRRSGVEPGDPSLYQNPLDR